MVITKVISTNIAILEMIFKRVESRQFKLPSYPLQSIKYYFSLRDVCIEYDKNQYLTFTRAMQFNFSYILPFKWT